ncbi:MAG: radical SAM protein [Anaerolineae bacterium]|jgi:radical SAM protein with 4Fe4S-binding SPASM domain
MAVSIGIGITNDCNLGCAHCYRPQDRVYHLSLDEIHAICETLDVASFNMGTGESLLHPEFPQIAEYLNGRGIKMSMASNGYSLTEMPAALLRRFHDVELSVDFATPQAQDAFRGAGNWDCVMAAIERCHNHGIEVTLLATLMNTNYDQMDRLVEVAGDVGANLRVNVYQPVGQRTFMLSYGQFWEAYRRLFGAGRLLGTSEPIIHAMLGLDRLSGSPCGRQSIRFTPRRYITPCVYWPQPDLTLDDLPGLSAEGILESEQFQRARHVPDACLDCLHVHSCGGGCASRRALLGDLNQPDVYCPLVRDETIHLSFTPAPNKDLPRGSNVCTTIIVP